MGEGPDFAPIEGVDLDGYAKATAAIAKGGAADADAAAKVAEANGIPKGKWAGRQRRLGQAHARQHGGAHRVRDAVREVLTAALLSAVRARPPGSCGRCASGTRRSRPC